ncbi:NAD-dependent epimerase/dehydratase family protein [Sphingomonas jatrophae]|uniref:Nucleoside-diphosphate-sugar epimerase n=1 Tax=Sphingomonas jatrophae TaxID=1166337 RepID=A0A1I6KG28_9SPHN|nr:NAD-dependent epimerase/dehydratase family protein [Sphingomonas jatrophae]SFR90201.1 Nucleoside-diphosphate-sugar epimerase [Sphingomonas jatrophae]
MRILVIGATGYLGGHLVRMLAGGDYAVTGLSRSGTGDARIVAAGGTALRGDLVDLAPVLAAAEAHDAVIYTAQLLLQPEHDAIAALIAALSGRNKTLIFTSGTGLLSQRTDGEWSEDSFGEDEPFVPSRYIGFRLVTETLVRTAGHGGQLRAMVVRPSMIWGHGGCGHLARFHRDADEHGDVGYVGRGLNLYSNVHVDDLATLYALALERGQPGALYHAVAGEENNRTLAEAVARARGLPARSLSIGEAIERWGKFTALVGMATCSRSRAPRSRRELGWQPTQPDILTDVDHPAYRAT